MVTRVCHSHLPRPDPPLLPPPPKKKKKNGREREKKKKGREREREREKKKKKKRERERERKKKKKKKKKKERRMETWLCTIRFYWAEVALWVMNTKLNGKVTRTARRSSLKGREKAIVNQTNIGTASKAALGKLVRDGVERIWVFPNA